MLLDPGVQALSVIFLLIGFVSIFQWALSVKNDGGGIFQWALSEKMMDEELSSER